MILQADLPWLSLSWLRATLETCSNSYRMRQALRHALRQKKTALMTERGFLQEA